MSISYDLNRPNRTYKLGKRYREISGICPVPGSNSLAFVQDEKIRVYGFDLSSEKIKKTKAFQSGDSEDVVVLGNSAYILVAGANPAVYKLTDYTDRNAPIGRYALELSVDYEPEGLCHDANGGRLLIACKGSPKPGDRKRQVFSFDLRTQTPNTDSPVFTIDTDALGIGSDTFNPSGIAIHPGTNDIYLIGTKEAKMLVCCGWDGTVKSGTKLDKNRYEQPEGVAFSESGELFICSEGKKKKARIFRFSS